MRTFLICFPLTFAGCASPEPIVVLANPRPVLVAQSATHPVEIPYEIAAYREPSAPDIRHEAHTVYRSIQIPNNQTEALTSEPRTKALPISFSPLPASVELGVELDKQKSITAEMRAMESSMIETQQKMQSQYAQLVRQTSEATQLRADLEAQRNARTTTSPSAGAKAPSEADAKW